jgi:hypothetical protein
MVHWDFISARAKEYRNSQKVFESFEKGKKYLVEEVTDTAISIYRIEEKTIAKLIKNTIDAIGEMVRNSFDGVDRQVIYMVALRAAFVELHPHIFLNAQTNRLVWQAEPKFMINSLGMPSFDQNENTNPAKSINTEDLTNLENNLSLINTDDDRAWDWINRHVRQRRFQSAFRLNMIRLFNERCAMTNTGPIDVLEAAHIFQHNISGVNDPANGLLLRSDIHILFDSHLLKIDPETLTIIVSSALKGSIYEPLNSKKISYHIPFEEKIKEFVRQRNIEL